MERIVSLQKLSLENFEPWSHGDNYGGAEWPLAEKWGAQALGFHLETLDPGKFSCPYHRHEGEEELFIALQGSCVLRQDGNFRRVQTGDLIFFPTGVCHQFFNPGPEPFVFFALSNRNKADVCEYPDSHKRIERNPRRITQDGKEIDDYWAGEENPSSFWPEEWLKPG
ncbi:cupin domain-containing protein [Oligoflexus tunisiensis]|uniref:cupin domain-containing protein n=1 Tax=Oligoflexus tunisiensis TaxID=708132 RepID=UPI00114CEC51|nr:cupin domain-containing protein [Oligoflexus tunisiensis]